jgi:hypothetical protein
MPTARLALAVVGLLGAPPVQAAPEEPCANGSCLERAPRPGTHFLVEVYGGGAVAGGSGPTFGGLIGVGGKPPLVPFRFYLIGELAFSSSGDEGIAPALGSTFRDERTRGEIDLGLRMYVPVWGPVRLFGDILGGGSHVTATFARRGWATLSEDYWQGTVVAAAGLQLRLFTRLALGTRVRFTLLDEDADRLRTAIGAASDRPIAWTAGMTWHF